MQIRLLMLLRAGLACGEGPLVVLPVEAAFGRAAADGCGFPARCRAADQEMAGAAHHFRNCRRLGAGYRGMPSGDRSAPAA